MQPRARSRRGVGAIVLSLGVHALAGVALWLAPQPAPPPSTSATLTWIDVPPPAVQAPPPPPPERAAPPTPAKGKPTKRAATAAAPTPAAPAAASTGTGIDTPLAETGTGPVAAPSKRPSLVPRAGFVMSMPEPLDAEDTRGTTLHNEPMDQPDEVAVREYQAEKAGRKLSLDLATDVARAQQGAGRLPGFFGSLSRSFEEAAAQEKVAVSNDSARAQLLDGVGSVLDPTRTKPTDTAVQRVAETAFVQNNRIGNPALPGDQRQFNEAVAQGFARIESIKDALSAPRLRTVVVLTTDPRGVLADASISERSGDRTFDESALHLSRKVMRKLPESDEKALGTSWWRSRWVFTWEPPRMKVRLLEATPLPPPIPLE